MYLQEKGIAWPGDISIVIIGTPEWAGMVSPPLTCIRRPEQEMGQAAAMLLLDKLNNPWRAPLQRIFPPTLEEGRSVAGPA